MKILNQIKTSQFAQKFKRPEGPNEEITGKNLVNDTMVFFEKSADFGTEIAGGLTLASSVSAASGNPLAPLAGFAVGNTIGKGLNAVSNFAGNTVTELTGSKVAGRLTRTAAKVGLMVGGTAALTGSLLPGVMALGISGLLLGAGQIFESLVTDAIGASDNLIKPEAKTELDAPNLLSSSARSEFDAPNLLSPNGKSEFDAPDLLKREADSRIDMAPLNQSSNPRVLIQTA